MADQFEGRDDKAARFFATLQQITSKQQQQNSGVVEVMCSKIRIL
jgi:hypothetical protein